MPTRDTVQPLPDHAEKKFQGEIFSVWQWEQELYDGSTATFERIARPDYAAAVGVMPDKKIMLVHDEQPHREVVITPAGGKVDAGESPRQAVEREFREETGYIFGKLVPWISYRPGEKLEMKIHIFVAKDLKLGAQPEPEAGEKITPMFYSFDEFVALGEEPMLRDWMLKIKLLEALLHEEKRERIKKLFYG